VIGEKSLPQILTSWDRLQRLIGGDGIRSSVRAQVAPAIGPVYAGYYIWRGAPNEADLKPKTRVTKSTTALPSTIGSVSRLANASCCTGASSAPTSV
jgi:hypothetical protein